MATRKKVTKRRQPAATVHAASSRTVAHVQLIVNGQAAGTIDPTGLSISQAANDLARGKGIKSYSILLNGGMKVGAEEAGAPLAGHTSLEVFAKETRG